MSANSTDEGRQPRPPSIADPSALGPRVHERIKHVLRALVALATDRSRAEVAADKGFRLAEQTARRTHDEAIARLEQAFQAECEKRGQVRVAAEQELAEQSKREHDQIECEYHEALERASRQLDEAEREAQLAYKEARWAARTEYEAGRERLQQSAGEVHKELRGHLQRARAIEQHANACLAYFGQKQIAAAPRDEPVAGDDEALIERLLDVLQAAEEHLGRLDRLRLPRFVVSGDFLMIFVALAAVIGPAAGWLAHWRPLVWIPPTAALILGIGVPVSLWLRGLARRQVRDQYLPLVGYVGEAEACCRRLMASAVARLKAQRAELRDKRDAEVRAAAQIYKPRIADCRLRRESEIPQLTAAVEARLEELKNRTQLRHQQLCQRFSRQEARARDDHQQALRDAHGTLDRALAATQAALDAARGAYLAAWQTGLADVRQQVCDLAEQVNARCPPWPDVLLKGFARLESAPEAVRFGALDVELEHLLPKDVSEQVAREAAAIRFVLPAVLAFPDQLSLLIRCQDAGRGAAVELLQTVMLRLLLTIPAGKVRYTIIDPVGLGQNFAAFMHLADYEEALVGHRIWTEPTQIEQRLADLTEHMETVIQKYLRDEYPTIGAYNLEAGEIAEPYRVLVIANFPAGFSESAARRLLSIATNGPRCGVHVLLSVDTRLPPIADFPLNDLAARATQFSIAGGRVVWHDRDLKTLPLSVDRPPGTEQFKAILQRVGQEAVSAKRVEVPFEAIAPPSGDYWTSDSRAGVDIPLGRVGATRLQHLRLGQGTSQHVLIAGKTGSGKSTLLHALIANAALRYSPDELELYLIDFKKGVEFKTYVTHALPHARVVAIESEREFGLSVMQRLDAEMRARGEQFREAGVQDIAGYRNLGNVLPRILFIVDEFQEFFVEDDKLAQEAALLLDRLIRQGRAFGIHVHLGSQTLAGAYTLARSTLGQVGVRIALQCSEADAHLILSEDNQAARLLSRPGEAIYNDANGLIEGNHPFQVVWLPDDRREVYLEAIQRLVHAHPPRKAPEQIVFEGTQPANIEKSRALAALLSGAVSPAAEPRIWIGEPLAIQETTSVTFPRRGASNLLWLGQNEDAVAGMISAALLSLAGLLPKPASDGRPQLPQVRLLCASHAGGRAWLDRWEPVLGDRLRVARSNELAALMTQCTAECRRRQSSPGDEAPLFLFVHDLARFRELRRQEESFSFSRASEASMPRPDRQFVDLLRDGPPVGIHTLVWCDSLTNFNRMLERQMLKEFETRVLLQMSVTDSSLLIDTPAASQLGRHRALLHREDEGWLEKFRPFSVPGEAWLSTVARALAPRLAPDR